MNSSFKVSFFTISFYHTISRHLFRSVNAWCQLIYNCQLKSFCVYHLFVWFVFVRRTSLLSTLISCLKSEDSNVRKVICFTLFYFVLYIVYCCCCCCCFISCYYTLNSLSLFWLAESVQLIFEIRTCDVITADYSIIMSRSRVIMSRSRVITLCMTAVHGFSTLIILDITKTSSKNCL